MVIDLNKEFKNSTNKPIRQNSESAKVIQLNTNKTARSERRKTIKGKKVVTMLVMGALLTSIPTAAIATMKTSSSKIIEPLPFKLTETSVELFKQEYKGKILLYHSHTGEAYADGYDIIKAGEDLAKKLDKKGYEVEHITEKFDVDYDNAYFASREMLLDKNLNEYDLIIDLHRDALQDKKLIGTDKKEQGIARLMFVVTTQSPNYEKQMEIVNQTSEYLGKFGDITRNTWEYDYGINFYNGDLSDKFVLIENGFNTNETLEVRRANTYLASALAQYLDKVEKPVVEEEEINAMGGK